MESTKEIGDRLRTKSIKPSVIRIKVLQYLLANRIHPNADTIYKALVKEIPTLSKTSIYNTLKTLSEKSLAIEVKGENGEIRYDGFTQRHAHFMCVECGRISDVTLECASCRTPDLKGSKVLEESVYLKGVCAGCNTTEVKKDVKNIIKR